MLIVSISRKESIVLSDEKTEKVLAKIKIALNSKASNAKIAIDADEAVNIQRTKD